MCERAHDGRESETRKRRLPLCSHRPPSAPGWSRRTWREEACGEGDRTRAHTGRAALWIRVCRGSLTSSPGKKEKMRGGEESVERLQHSLFRFLAFGRRVATQLPGRPSSIRSCRYVRHRLGSLSVCVKVRGTRFPGPQERESEQWPAARSTRPPLSRSIFHPSNARAF